MNYKEKIESLQKKGLVDDEQAQKLSETLQDDEGIQREQPHEPKSYDVVKISLVLFIVLFILFAGNLFVSYNNIVTKEEQTKVAWAQVESNLQRKLDLLPNLVKVVKQYAKHEKEVFTEVTALRAGMQKNLKNGADIKTLAKSNSKLQNAVNKIMLISERYPDLKSSEHFLELQSQIEGSENRINITRMMFNDAVGSYNSYIHTIPAKFIAEMGNFKPKAYFKAEKKAHKKFDIGM